MVERHGRLDYGARGDGAIIRHAAREGGRDGEAGGIHVVLHIILGRMGENDRRFDRAYDRTEPPERAVVVKDLQIPAHRRMPGRAENFCGGTRFSAPDARNFRGVHGHAAEIAGGQIQDVKFPARFAQE